MFVLSKRNIILPGPNGEKFHMPRDYMGPVPAWAEGSAYLQALAADGKVVVTASGSDRETAAAEKKAGKGKSGKGKQPSGKPPAEDAGENEPAVPQDTGGAEEGGSHEES